MGNLTEEMEGRVNEAISNVKASRMRFNYWALAFVVATGTVQVKLANPKTLSDIVESSGMMISLCFYLISFFIGVYRLLIVNTDEINFIARSLDYLNSDGYKLDAVGLRLLRFEDSFKTLMKDVRLWHLQLFSFSMGISFVFFIFIFLVPGSVFLIISPFVLLMVVAYTLLSRESFISQIGTLICRLKHGPDCSCPNSK